MGLSVLVAPSGFKESLSVRDATEAIAAGVARAMPDAEIIMAPMVDGGEGFVEALVDATGGTIHPVPVVGPVGATVDGFFGLLGGAQPTTAVIEIAAAAGLSLVPRDLRDPTRTTSYGVGQLLAAALDAGARRILIGCGDSGINDAGAGMIQALGGRLLDAEGRDIGLGGAALAGLARVDLSGLDARIRHVRIDAAVNWHNRLLGERGVSRVYGPQKGASPEQVETLERALAIFAERVFLATGVDVAAADGAGASGGLGAALMGLLGATLHPRYDIVMSYLDLDRLLAGADLVITGEGSLDGQTPFGKVPAEVGRRARSRGVPAVALAGTIGKGCALNFDHGIDAFASIIKTPCSLDDAIAEARTLLTRAAEDIVRAIMVGIRLAADTADAPSRGIRRFRDSAAAPPG